MLHNVINDFYTNCKGIEKVNAAKQIAFSELKVSLKHKDECNCTLSTVYERSVQF